MTAMPPPIWTKEGRQAHEHWYRAMREHHPVTFHKDINAYGVFRYDDARAIFRDDVNWSVQRRFAHIPDDERELHILADTVNALDPPDHSRLRLLAMPAFAPNQIAGLEATVRGFVTKLLDDVLSRGQFDVVNDFALRVPQMVINHTLGIPPEDFQKSMELSARIQATTGRYAGAPFEDIERERAATRECRAYFDNIVAARRAKDHGDVMSMLVHAQQEGDRLSGEELFKMAMIIYGGGVETTMTAITNMVRLMIEHPEEYRRLQADRSLIPTAVDEILRYCPPAHSMSRVATHNVEIGGVVIPENALVLMWLPAANRDPEAFSDPERFDVGRTPNRHLSLGYGAHVCIGMHLARLELQIVLEQWLDRVATFHRTDDTPIEWTDISLVAISPKKFPIRVTRR